MSKREMLVVVGAGASAEFGLPTGNELKDRIARLLNMRFDEFGTSLLRGDRTIFQALRSIANGHVNPYILACRQISDAMPQAVSIDHYLNAHRDDERVVLCGKLAIASSILREEAKSLANSKNRTKEPDLVNLSSTWINRFMQIVTEDCRAEDLGERLATITFIIFNYDRCVEHLMYYWLKNYYAMDGEMASSLVRNVEILHPYGSLGHLPWWDQTQSVEFGADPSYSQLLNAASMLRTFTEGTDVELGDIVAIRQRVTTAERVLFLGFAYHRLNLELLVPQPFKEKVRSVHVYGTGKGLSEADRSDIYGTLVDMFSVAHSSVSVVDATCADLFYEFRRRLSLV